MAADPPTRAAPLSLRGMSVEGVNQCVHCGLCLAYCPTFSELGTEMDSPRGRIFLIKSLAEGRIALSDSTVRHLSLCLDCRACETVCPAGVPYGRLIEAAKAEIEHQRPGGHHASLVPDAQFRLAARPACAVAGRRGRASLLPGDRDAGAGPGHRAGSSASGHLAGLGGPDADHSARRPIELSLPPLIPAGGPRRARVALLTGCVQSVVFGPHNRATARVLARNGVEVVVPPAQGCCGALQRSRRRPRAGARAGATHD